MKELLSSGEELPPPGRATDPWESFTALVDTGLGFVGLGLIGLAIGVAMVGAVTLLRAQLAFRAGTWDSLEQAAATGNSESLEQWGEVLNDGSVMDRGAANRDIADQYAGYPGNRSNAAQAEQAFRLSARANPRAAGAWMGLGFAAERDGNFVEARDAFERVFEVDRQYLPAWTLANFCFRREDTACFWRAARRAADMAPRGIASRDLQPLLALALRRAPSAVTALDRLGGGPRLTRACLDFLIRERRMEDALGVARLMIGRRGKGEMAGDMAQEGAQNAAQLEDFVNRLIDEGSFDASIEIWNGLAQWENELPASPARREALDPMHGIVLTGGDLGARPRNSGFDWRVDQTTGHWEPGQLVFDLSSSEGVREGTAETRRDRELLRQILPLTSGRYRLRFEYSARGGAARAPYAAALFWTLGRAASPPLLLPTAAAEWQKSEWTFQVAERGFQVLRLMYWTEAGASGAGGGLRLKRLRLEVA